mmetsp:Transcript_23014/g.34333  ORF Transcript_23014/g.34333 Transcript_23014/m.34333 type:complete len:601 (+) Transcript_23014:77-1879(+)
MPTIMSTIDKNNNGDFDVVTTSSTDVEKGIETPLPFEEGVEIPLATFENDLKKKKQPPSTPTTIASTSSDDTFVNDTSAGTKRWSSWTTLDYTLALVATLAVASVILFFSILFASKPSTNNNNSATTSTQLQVQRIGNNGKPNNIFPLSKCRGDCDNDQECQEGLICYQRGSYGGVPGCLGGDVDGSGTDYCVVAVDEYESNDDESKGNSRPINSPSSSSSTTTYYEPPTQPRDLFLLSGQSNMVGHTTSAESMTGSADYWNTIKSILDSAVTAAANGGTGNLTSMEEQLYNVIYEANESNNQVATTLTNGVMDLYKSGLLNGLDTPLQFGKCSFQEASDSKVYDVSRGTVPISSKSNCGHSFGHELLFARTMELGSSMNYNTTRDFELHKVARGGSGLYEHWYPNHGMHWDLLRSAIEERRGHQGDDWKGFIWHQGSQAVWSAQQYGEDRSLTYYGNLTGLVNEVRELMFQNSVTWRCKEEIPVVIVQVGYWPGYNNATRRTRDAQARFCTQDPRAVLVKTDDLSRYYHYDAASFLISGNRIAHAYQEALGGVVECPDDRVPSSSPSENLSMEPSMSLEPTVLRMETDLPSSISTNEPV